MTLLVAPRYESIEGPLIFLAGPIQGAPPWQDDAIRILQEIAPDIHLANPRREGAHYKKGEFAQELYNEQVDWETHHLRRAADDGLILFWLAKEAEHRCDRAYGQSSRFEIGEWKKEHESIGTPLVVGIDVGFTGGRYIRRRFGQDCPDVPIIGSLEETCKKAIELLHQFEREPFENS